LESSKNDTSIYPRYNSVWDTLKFRETPLLVGFTSLDWLDDLDNQNLIAGMFPALVINLSLRLVINNRLLLFLQ
jgi:hypothetical protein